MPMRSFTAPDPLFTTEVSLSSLNRNVSEKELDLLQFPTAGVTELRARAAKVMRSERREAEPLRGVFHHLPHNPFGYAVAPVLACSTDAAKQFSG
jgi:hypothetical protein